MRQSTLAVLLLSGIALPISVAAAQQAAHDPAPTAVPRASVELAAPAAPRAAPKLIIAISVDQYSADLFSEYRQLYTGGLARMAGGVVFPQGFQSHGNTETCPGHSTILTGSYPARTGIISNNWFDQSLTRDDKKVYCSEDPTVPGTSSAAGHYSTSNHYLRVPTLGDRMIAANAATQVVSVAGKDRAAIMMGGHRAQELWWLSPTGLSSFPGVQPSPTISRISTALTSALAQPRPPMTLPAQCQSRSVPVDIGGGRTVGTGLFGRTAGNFRGVLASPEADGDVLAAAATLREARHLGEGATTDLLILGLSATDYVGHTYGTEGSEMCVQMLALDQQLGEFFARMDATGIDYAVVLTADHGGHDLPERNDANAAPSAVRVDPALTPAALGARIKAELHLTLDGPVILGDAPFGDMYVNRTLAPAVRNRVIATAERILTSSPQVDRVVRGSVLAAMPLPHGSPELWTVEQRLRASYDAERSGDFLVVLKPRVTPIPTTDQGYVATHGSVWDYDRRVPILFWRAGMRGFEQPNPVMTVDILPTLAGLIDLPVPAAEIDGRCLDLASGPQTTCPTP